jgi:hypothetical protein
VCLDNPSSVNNERFGSSVAVGNFHFADATGSSTSICAAAHDVGVGVPGFNGGRGRVLIFRPNNSGSFMTPGVAVSAVTPTPNAFFGSMLAAGHAQTSETYEDLLVGAPGDATNDGRVSLSRSYTSSANASGTYTFTDAAGASIDAVFANTSGVLTIDGSQGMTLGMSACALNGNAASTIPVNSTISIALSSWSGTTGMGTFPITTSAGTFLIDVTITFDGVNELTVSISNAEATFAGCTLTPNPITMTRTATTVCE